MIETSDMIEAFARNAGVLHEQCAGLTQEESLLQLPFRGNCMNWVLGHIAIHRSKILHQLGLPPLEGPDLSIYDRGSEQLDVAGPIVPSVDLLAYIDASQEPIATFLSTTDEEQIKAVGSRLFFRYFHETYHVGQTELLRQLAGKNDKVI